MKHFIILSTYTVPFEQLGDNIADHRAFLQAGYDRGMLLCSGPQATKTGGAIIARASSIEELQGFFHGDPYQKRGLAKYQFIEFEPVKHQAFLENWLKV
ncbi:MAG: YciI family protein [Dissulfurispiraceae bacterium]|jgi:uncharacterized protein YciI